MNTGLDCKPEKLRLPKDDPYYDKLAFFDKYQLHWTNPDRWDLPDTRNSFKYKETIFKNYS